MSQVRFWSLYLSDATQLIGTMLPDHTGFKLFHICSNTFIWGYRFYKFPGVQCTSARASLWLRGCATHMLQDTGQWHWGWIGPTGPALVVTDLGQGMSAATTPDCYGSWHGNQPSVPQALEIELKSDPWCRAGCTAMVRKSHMESHAAQWWSDSHTWSLIVKMQMGGPRVKP